MTTVSVGFLSGAHVHTDPYASRLSSFDDVTLVGIADTDSKRGQQVANTHGIDYLPRDELLEQIDGAIVCGPNKEHGTWIRAAAEAGVDVLCEKPLETEYEAAIEIADVCESEGINAGVAMPRRFSPHFEQARERLEAGDLGTLYSIIGTNRGKMPGGWFVDPAKSGGGAVADHTVHIVDIVQWITGERVASVYAETDTLVYDISVEDTNILSMELTDGTVFTLDGSWSRPEQWDTWGDGKLELIGSEEVIAIDPNRQALKCTRDVDGGVSAVNWGTDTDERMMRDFVNAVQAGRDPKTPIREGATAVAVIEAAYESARRNEPVTIEY